MNFRNKLFLSYATMIFLLAGILGSLAYCQSHFYIKQELQNSIKDSMKKITDNIEYRLSTYEHTIEYVSFNSDVHKFIKSPTNSVYEYQDIYMKVFDPMLATLKSTNNDLLSMNIFTSDSDVVERRNLILSMDNLEKEPWFSTVINNSGIHWIHNDESIIGLCRINVVNTSDVYVVKMDFSKRKAFACELNNQQDYYIVISDQDNNTVYINNQSSQLSDTVSKEIAAIEEGGIYRENFVDYYILTQPIQMLGWKISVAVNTESLQPDPRAFFGATMIVIMLALILSLFVAWLLSGFLVKEIRYISRAMDEVAKGNLQITISSNSNDEIGKLTKNFGRMLQDLNELIEKNYTSEILRKDAMYKALQYQINPHFLYNILSVVNWKAISSNMMEISYIINELSGFYRSVLSNSDPITTVATELENTRRYIDLQLVMHEYSFDVEYNIDEKVLDAKVIHMLLQPIVENAIAHGLDCRREHGAKLTIRAFREGNILHFIVHDNGPGFGKDKLEKIFNKNTNGYGIKNVNDRIQIYYGKSFGLQIRSDKTDGTYVDISVPFEYKERTE